MKYPPMRFVIYSTPVGTHTTVFRGGEQIPGVYSCHGTETADPGVYEVRLGFMAAEDQVFLCDDYTVERSADQWPDNP
jgi:hypothetical protein